MLRPLLVVFDLDETLIHASSMIAAASADFRSGPYRCIVRPGARELVAHALERFDVGVWTSAGSLHCDSVVEALFPDRSALRFVWSAERCVRIRDFDRNEIVPLKQLNKLKGLGFGLDRIVAIDDSPEKHQRNYGNLLRVKPWMGEPDDDELFDVARYLNWLAVQESVRRVEKRGWRQQRHWRT